MRTVVQSGGNGSGGALFDLNDQTSWAATEAGQAVSVLLEDSIPLEAVAVGQASGSGGYRLSGSDNYRDWWLLAERSSGDDSPPVLEEGWPARSLRYLRLEATGAGVWHTVLAGPAGTVAEDLSALEPYDWGEITSPAVIETMMSAAFSWQWSRVNLAADNLDWLHGALHAGIAAAYRETGEVAYRDAILAVGNHANWTLLRRTTGKGLYHADDQCIGQSWLELYEMEPQPQATWIADVKARIDWVMANPLQGRVDYNWCDALFMAPPIYSRLATLTGDAAYQDFIDTQWWDVTAYLYDPTWHLFYRDSNYFDAQEANGNPVFWSRGNGWVIAGLVRMLQFMPPDAPDRTAYLGQLREMAARLAAIQDPVDGLWRSSLLYPERFDNEPETSGSAFFVFALAWGVNEGLLDRSTYAPVIERGWAGLAALLQGDGALAFIQQVGAAPARNNQEPGNKEYGYGAFLLAASEMHRFYGIGEVSVTTGGQPLSSVITAIGDGSTNWEELDRFADAAAWTTQIQSAGTGAGSWIVPDPFATEGSTVLRLWGGNGPNNVRARRALPPIPNGTVATLYTRFAVDDSILDLVLGVSDVATVTGYGDYETGLRLFYNSNRFEARAGGQYVPVSDDLVQLQTWYEVWTVIDTASDTYDLYLRGGSHFREQTLLRADIPFRNGAAANPILSFAATLNPSPGIAQSRGSVYLDDFFLDRGGENLSRPAGVAVPRYSPWSDAPRDPWDASKRTPLGRVWDDDFPWIYHTAVAAWLWIPDGADEVPGSRWVWSPWAGWLYLQAKAQPHDEAVFAYSSRAGGWWFFPSSFRGWYYSHVPGDEGWKETP